MKPANLIRMMLDEITSRYDAAIADRVWSFTQAEVEDALMGEDVDFNMWRDYQAIAITTVMREEGFSASEIIDIQLTALEKIRDRRISPDIRERLTDISSYDERHHPLPPDLRRRLERELDL